MTISNILCQCPESGGIHFYGTLWEYPILGASRGHFCRCFGLDVFNLSKTSHFYVFFEKMPDFKSNVTKMLQPGAILKYSNTNLL